MVIKSYHIILAVKILGWFLLKWAGFGELLGWKSSTRSGNTDCTLASVVVRPAGFIKRTPFIYIYIYIYIYIIA